MTFFTDMLSNGMGSPIAYDLPVNSDSFSASALEVLQPLGESLRDACCTLMEKDETLASASGMNIF